MATYRTTWECCDQVTETEAWEPEVCPFCHPSMAICMADVDRSIAVRKAVNDMLLADFARMVAEHTKTEYDQEKVDNFGFIGLSNIDYYTHGYYKDEPDGIAELHFTKGDKG